ncbi:MAG: hypothetical protein R2697_08290 [Ilumatobacteraceae bacterium]
MVDEGRVDTTTAIVTIRRPGCPRPDRVSSGGGFVVGEVVTHVDAPGHPDVDLVLDVGVDRRTSISMRYSPGQTSAALMTDSTCFGATAARLPDTTRVVLRLAVLDHVGDHRPQAG